MALAEKEAVVNDLKDRFSGASASFVVDYQGCSCEALTGLRRKLKPTGARFNVIKNTLARRAVADSGTSGLDEFFVGPTAVVWADEDPVGPAKAITDFAKEQEKFEIKAAFVDGAVVDASQVKALAALPSKEELLGQLLALINAPATRLLQTINAPAAQLARLMEAVRAKKESENN